MGYADLVLIDLAVAVQTEGRDAIKDTLSVPGHPGNAPHCPAHPAAAQLMIKPTGAKQPLTNLSYHSSGHVLKLDTTASVLMSSFTSILQEALQS